MNLIQLTLSNILIFSLIYFIFKKFNLFIDNTSFSAHKKIGKENNLPIVLGGVYIITITLIYYPNEFLETKLIFLLIFILGLMSDKNILINTKLRLFFQIILISSLVYFSDLKISDLRSDFLNEILHNNIFNIFFTIFCLAVLINGSNFIDGLNGLLSGYYILLIGSILFICHQNPEINFLNQKFIELLLISLIIFLIPNIYGKVYLGDGGSYLIAAIIGYFLIDFYHLNQRVSPYYISLLLWYPAFENLFSLLRRIKNKKNVSSPDNRHLHQIIFFFIKKKKYFKRENVNLICSGIILFINLPGFIIGSIYYDKSIILAIILLYNLIMYCLVYYKMSKLSNFNK